jgi:hypothetical protein
VRDVVGGFASDITNDKDFRLPTVTAGQSFQGTLSYSTDQPHTWNVTQKSGSFTLQEFSISFGGNLLVMGIGPFGMHLQNDVLGSDSISLSGGDDTGFALLNGKVVRAISLISLVDLDGAALSSVALMALPQLLSFEERHLEFILGGYFGPYGGSSYKGEIEALTQTPLPAALPLFASAMVVGGMVAWRKRRVKKRCAATASYMSESATVSLQPTARIGRWTGRCRERNPEANLEREQIRFSTRVRARN